jgi:hypothetical protein
VPPLPGTAACHRPPVLMFQVTFVNKSGVREDQWLELPLSTRLNKKLLSKKTGCRPNIAHPWDARTAACEKVIIAIRKDPGLTKQEKTLTDKRLEAKDALRLWYATRAGSRRKELVEPEEEETLVETPTAKSPVAKAPATLAPKVAASKAAPSTASKAAAPSAAKVTPSKVTPSPSKEPNEKDDDGIDDSAQGSF